MAPIPAGRPRGYPHRLGEISKRSLGAEVRYSRFLSNLTLIGGLFGGRSERTRITILFTVLLRGLVGGREIYCQAVY
jgi:hypothetical protein